MNQRLKRGAGRHAGPNIFNPLHISSSCYSKNANFFVISLLLLIMSTLVLGQENIRIYGNITDKKNSKPLENVLIFLLPGNRFAESDQNGDYEISDLTAGLYELHIQLAGYTSPVLEKIEFTAGMTKKLDFSLDEKIYSQSEPIVITATRGETNTFDVPASMSVVSAENISVRSPLNSSEVLQNLQGTYIKDYGSLNAVKTISLRGSSAEQVLVLLDGQRMNNPQTGQVDLGTICLDGIERVEILRGGSSAVYGADAVGGVVNLISKEKQHTDNFDASVKALSGSFGTVAVDGHAGLDYSWFNASLNYQRLQSNGNFIYPDQNGDWQERQNNDVNSHHIFSDLNFRLGESWNQSHLDFSYLYYTADRGVPGTLDYPSLSARQWDTRQKIQSTLSGKIVNPLHSYHVQGFWGWDKSRFDEPQGFFATDARNKSGNYGLETYLKSVLSSENTVTYGVGFRREWMESNQFLEDHNRQIYYLFIQDEISILAVANDPRLLISLIPAIRYDKYSDFGSRWSPKIGSSLAFGSIWELAIKSNLGWSFRAPTFNELYWPADMWSSGNPNLKPESGFDWDLGLNLRAHDFYNLSFNIIYFNTMMKDLIQWQSLEEMYIPVNISKSKNEGLELNSSLSFFNNLLSIAANYTYLDARNKSNDPVLENNFLVYRPKNLINMDLNFDWKLFTLGLDYRYVDKRYTDETNENYLPPYRIYDLNFRIKHKFYGWRTTLHFQIKNIFKEKYQVIYAQPLPGREYRVSIEIAYH